MEYEDSVTIPTPEGVDLTLTLAGLGSRFVAALTDLLIQGTVVLAAALLFVGTTAFSEDATASGVGAAVFFVVFFLVMFGYDILFEVLASGRTPGKRVSGIRVVRVGGQPVGFLTSSVRNLLRLIDILPFGYLVGCIAVLASPRNQRLGDIVAGTLVVRERHGRSQPTRRWQATRAADTVDGLSSWDVSAVSPEELGVVRGFLERRDTLAPAARSELARTLAGRLRSKTAGAPDGLADERFLEQLAAAKLARR